MTLHNFPSDKAKGALAVQASREFMQAADRLSTLYALAEEWNDLLGLLEQPEPDEEAIEAELRRVAANIREKAEALAVVHASLEHRAAYRKAEADRMRDKAKADQNAADRLKDYAMRCMESIGEQRIDTGRYTLRIQKNSIPTVVVEDESKVPAAFQKVTYTVNKTAIAAHVKETGEIPDGVSVVHGTHLVIA